MTRTVRIGGLSALGPLPLTEARALAAAGLDFLVIDCLDAAGLARMADARRQEPGHGYASGFVEDVQALLGDGAGPRPRVISNAGGLNPLACAEALRATCHRLGLDLKIAALLGNDLPTSPPGPGTTPAREAGRPSDTGETWPTGDAAQVGDSDCATAWALLGAPGIAEALDRGADWVITGLMADGALASGALLHAFGWARDDYPRLAQAALAGHLLEGGAGCTGGRCTDWEDLPDPARPGLPVVEMEENGDFVLTAVAGSGGRVTPLTVGEQLLESLGDPRAHRLPDVICDFTQVTLEHVPPAPAMSKPAAKGGATSSGVLPGRVAVRGARGLPPDDRYLTRAHVRDGFRCTATFLLAGLDAPKKARRSGRALLERGADRLASRGWAPFLDSSLEVLGSEARYGFRAQHPEAREVVMTLTVRHACRNALRLFSQEVATAARYLAPGIACLEAESPPVHPSNRTVANEVPKERCPVEVDLAGQRHPVALPAPAPLDLDALREAPDPPAPRGEADVSVPLVALAVARSSGEGCHANIGVLARRPGYLPWIAEALGNQAVVDWMSHVLDPQLGQVGRWYLPGSHSLNFLLENVLGGDTQARTFAQQLLAFPIPIPRHLAADLPGQHGDPRIEEPGGRVMTDHG